MFYEMNVNSASGISGRRVQPRSQHTPAPAEFRPAKLSPSGKYAPVAGPRRLRHAVEATALSVLARPLQHSFATTAAPRRAEPDCGDDVMGIFDALNTSVGGLQAQSFALQNISGNIANAQTTGFKGINTSFVDLVPDATNPDRQVAGGVTAYARQTVSAQGTVSASAVATYMAINGDGFFSVQKSTGTVDNVPVFSGVTDY